MRLQFTASLESDIFRGYENIFPIMLSKRACLQTSRAPGGSERRVSFSQRFESLRPRRAVLFRDATNMFTIYFSFQSRSMNTRDYRQTT